MWGDDEWFPSPGKQERIDQLEALCLSLCSKISVLQAQLRVFERRIDEWGKE